MVLLIEVMIYFRLENLLQKQYQEVSLFLKESSGFFLLEKCQQNYKLMNLKKKYLKGEF
jgi:hypothetical protein